jgi:hypothetical protein
MFVDNVIVELGLIMLLTLVMFVIPLVNVVLVKLPTNVLNVTQNIIYITENVELFVQKVSIQTTKPENVKNVQDLAEPVMVQMRIIV